MVMATNAMHTMAPTMVVFEISNGVLSMSDTPVEKRINQSQKKKRKNRLMGQISVTWVDYFHYLLGAE